VSVFHDSRVDVAGKLTAAGITNVTLDPAALPPFVLVDMVTRGIAPEGVGAWRCEIPVRVVVPPPGDTHAVAALEDTLELVIRTLGFAPFNAEPYELGARTADGDPVQCPSYTAPYPVSIPNPDC
jgi:hypothetical protein